MHLGKRSVGVSGDLPMIETASADLAVQAPQSSWFSWSDWAGMVASIGCAIHCAAMPFVIAYLPALGLSFLADEAFHKWMAIGCFVIALTAFVPGLRKHRRLTPVIIGSVGLVMISVAAFGFAGECCAACEDGSITVATATPSMVDDMDSPVDAQVCTDDCCPHCASENATVDTKTARDALADVTSQSSLVLGIVPWLTPFGGITLVFAHLLNRRFGCLCGCCDSGSSETTQ